MNEMSTKSLIKKDTCSTCPKKIRLSDGRLECHAMPPTETPILAAGADGKPIVIGQINTFPHPNPDWFCWQHPALVMRGALSSLYQDAEGAN